MRRRLAHLAAALALVALAGSCGDRGGLTPRPEGPLLHSEPLLRDQRPWTGVPGIDLVSARVLTSGSVRFGGWSGVRVRDGLMTAISDRGYWLQVPLGADGVPQGAHAALGRLTGLDGRPLLDDDLRDAEELVPLPDGGWLVSFERDHRLWHYPAAAEPFSEAPVAVAGPPGLEDLPYNGGIEAMTLLPDGRLLILAEGAGGASTSQGWITTAPLSTAPLSTGPLSTGSADTAPQWRPVTLAGDGDHLPTSAAVADDALWVLERSWGPLSGFSSRLRRIPLADVVPGARLDGPVVVRFDDPPVSDNFEGLSADGDHLVAITDDNYNGLQRTLLLVFRPGSTPSGATPS